jgi:hypothetical protein
MKPLSGLALLYNVRKAQIYLAKLSKLVGKLLQLSQVTHFENAKLHNHTICLDNGTNTSSTAG